MSHEKQLANPMTDPQKITHAQAREILEEMVQPWLCFSNADYKRLLAYIAQQESNRYAVMPAIDESKVLRDIPESAYPLPLAESGTWRCL